MPSGTLEVTRRLVFYGHVDEDRVEGVWKRRSVNETKRSTRRSFAPDSCGNVDPCELSGQGTCRPFALTMAHLLHPLSYGVGAPLTSTFIRGCSKVSWPDVCGELSRAKAKLCWTHFWDSNPDMAVGYFFSGRLMVLIGCVGQAHFPSLAGALGPFRWLLHGSDWTLQ